MFARFAITASAAVFVLNAATAHGKLEKGTWRGVPWQHHMNLVPAGCKQSNGVCSVTGQWHKSGRSEYYALGQGQNQGGTSFTAGGYEGRKNQTDAEDFCATIGGSLIQVETENELLFAISLLTNNRHGFWLGLEKRDSSMFPTHPLKLGFNHWLDGSKVEYTNWAVGEPNSPRYGVNHPQQDQYIDECAFSGSNQGDPSLWVDAECSKKRRVICERKLPDCVEKSDPDDPAVCTCVGARDPLECEGYYQMPCFDVNGDPAIGFDNCPAKCNSCQTTVTTFVTTTTSLATTTTSLATTTSTFATTTTSLATSTTTLATSTTSLATSTTTFGTTTTTGSTTTFGTTTTTAEPTTVTTTTEEQPEFGPCRPGRSAKGWHSINTDFEDLFAPLVVGEEPMHCCYKYHNKPRLTWDEAQAECEGNVAMYPMGGATGGLATPYVPEINHFLVDTVMLSAQEFAGCRGNASVTGPLYDEKNCRTTTKSRSTWLGGKTLSGSNVTWTSPFFQGNYSGLDYGNTSGVFAFADDTGGDDNGMFYKGEPSGLNNNFGRTGNDEDCLSQGSSNKKTNNAYGLKGWNDARCSAKKAYFCEYCVREPTTTTFGTTTTSLATTTTSLATTTTSLATTTTSLATTSTSAGTTSTTAEPTTSSAAPDCAEATCADDCGPLYKKKDAKPWIDSAGKKIKGWTHEGCGWSKKHKACIFGGITHESELGLCTSTTAGPQATKAMSTAEKCLSTYCPMLCGYTRLGENWGSPWGDFTIEAGPANDCEQFVGTTCIKSECGWSKKQNRCIPGGRTNDKEASFDFNTELYWEDPDANRTSTPGVRRLKPGCLAEFP